MVWNWGIKDMHPKKWGLFAEATDEACRDKEGSRRKAIAAHVTQLQRAIPSGEDPADAQRQQKAQLQPTLDALGDVVTDMLTLAMAEHFEPSMGREVSPYRPDGSKSAPWWNDQLQGQKSVLNARRRQFLAQRANTQKAELRAEEA